MKHNKKGESEREKKNSFITDGWNDGNYDAWNCYGICRDTIRFKGRDLCIYLRQPKQCNGRNPEVFQ